MPAPRPSSGPPSPAPARVADVLLRHPAPRRVRLHWPPPGAGRPGLVVLLTDGPVDGAGALADRLAAVVLAAPAADIGSAHAALSWAADHAAELGADPARLALAGPAEPVGRVARRVHDEGWPPLGAVVALRRGDDPAAKMLAAGWAR